MRFLTIFCVFIFITAPVFADSKHDHLTKELHSFNDKFNQFVADRDMDSFLSLYSKEVLWIAPAKPPVKGHGEPRATLQFVKDQDGQITHTIDKLMIADDGTQAVMIGSVIAKAKKIGMDATGTYLFVLKRESKECKIVTDMWHQHAEK